MRECVWKVTNCGVFKGILESGSERKRKKLDIKQNGLLQHVAYASVSSSTVLTLTRATGFSTHWGALSP